MRAPGYLASFDSATAMVRALARCLHGREFPTLGLASTALLRPLAPVLNALPGRAREQIYTWSGFSEAIPTRKLADVRADQISEWVVSEYPRRRYPAAMVGSSNGAAVHLCAALGVPWLPQTFLIPVRHSGLDKDEPRQAMGWGAEPGRALLEANSDLQLHHMHDANHDRLMISKMAYFRVKRLRLGEAYERFLESVVSPGGTLFVLDCRRAWPTTRVAERHFFQHGALGGAYADEYVHGGERVQQFLHEQGSSRTRWETPDPDAERPEAEWGFEPAMLADVERLGSRCGFSVRRLVFEEPEHLSPLVADLYRRWYAERQLGTGRLLVASFILLEPLLALRTGAVPFWTKFSVEPCAAWLERYLDAVEPYDEIYAMLFSHGVDSIGLAGIDRWRAVLERARREGRFLGVDERAFPRDFAVFLRYHAALEEVKGRLRLPEPLSLAQLDDFLAENGGRYPVRWQ